MILKTNHTLGNLQRIDSSLNMNYRKKVFVPPKDPNYDPNKEIIKEQEANEHLKALGREVTVFFPHHLISDIGSKHL